VTREYQAVVFGLLTGGGKVDQPIGRHPHDRIKMAVREGGREAVTHYRLLERFREHSHVKVQLETGRTHQIRVHMSHLRHPIVGDRVYAGRHRVPAGARQELLDYLQHFKRQALHAWQLSFVHPGSGDNVSYQAPLPDDILQLINLLKIDAAENEAS
jgi:23S rRNA pseudouridine1911/1915/1917 synthase